MKRLLLTLSLICLSWGAGANDFGTKTELLFKYPPRLSLTMPNNSAPINECLKAANNGFELTNRTFELEENIVFSAIHHRKFLYKNQLYVLIILEHIEDADTGIKCNIQKLKN